MTTWSNSATKSFSNRWVSNFWTCTATKEAGYLHIGCIESLDDALVGGLILAPVNNEEIRMMQVAVDSRYQGEGIGREMVKYAEKRAREAGYSRLVMHAMLSVVNFYEKWAIVRKAKSLKIRASLLPVWSKA